MTKALLIMLILGPGNAPVHMHSESIESMTICTAMANEINYNKLANVRGNMLAFCVAKEDKI